MHRCHFCGKILHEVPFRCRRCGKIFCSNHHLPESHHCSEYPKEKNVPKVSAQKFLKEKLSYLLPRKKYKYRPRSFSKRRIPSWVWQIVGAAILIGVYFLWINLASIAPESIKPVVNFVDAYTAKSVDHSIEIEPLILKYTNQERSSRGLPELASDSKLQIIARDHSRDMAVNNFFNHVNPAGEDPTARAARHGYPTTKNFGSYYMVGIGENIGDMAVGNVEGIGLVPNDANAIAKAMVNQWMNSPGHRANILNAQYSRLGAGVYPHGQGYLITQDFW